MARPVRGRSYRDAPEVDGLVLVRSDALPGGEMVRVKIERALAYDCSAARRDAFSLTRDAFFVVTVTPGRDAACVC